MRILVANAILLCVILMVSWPALPHIVPLFLRAQAQFGWPIAILIAALILTVAVWVWRRTLSPLLATTSAQQDAEIAMQAANFDEAERILLATIANAKNVKAGRKGSIGKSHWTLVCLYEKLGRLSEAVDQCRLAKAAVEGDGSPYGRQIAILAPEHELILLERLGRWAEAAHVCLDLLALDTGRSASLLHRRAGNALMETGLHDEALAHLEKAASLAAPASPDLAYALQSLAKAQLDDGNPHAAVATLTGAIHRVRTEPFWKSDDPDEQAKGTWMRKMWLFESLRMLGDAYTVAREPAIAADAIDEAALLSEELELDAIVHATCLFHLAEALFASGQKDAAAARAKQSIELFDEVEDKDHDEDDCAAEARQLLEQIQNQSA